MGYILYIILLCCFTSILAEASQMNGYDEPNKGLFKFLIFKLVFDSI